MLYLNFTLALLISVILGTNNLTAISSQIVSAKLTLKRAYYVTVLLGFFTGVMLSSEVYKTMNNLPARQYGHLAFIVALETLSLLIIFTKLGLPASITQMLIGSWAGNLLAKTGVLNYALLICLVLSWTLSPIIALLASRMLYPAIVKSFAKRLSLLKAIRVGRLGGLLALYTASASLGATGIGVTAAIFRLTMPEILAVGVVAGLVSGLVSYKPAFKQGYNLIMLGFIGSMSSLAVASTVTLGFALAGLPVSLTHVIIGSFIGAGLAHQLHVFNMSRLYAMMASWVMSFVSSFLLGLLIATI